MTLRSSPFVLALATLSCATLASAATAQDRGGRRGGFPGFGDSRTMPVMVALDADGDGELSEEEIDDAWGALSTLDANEDGNLTSDEIAPDLGGGGRGGFGGMAAMMAGMMHDYPVMKALDLDGDRELFEDEVTEATELLLTLDVNDDGALTGEELESPGRGGFGGFGGGRGPGGRPGGGGRGGFGRGGGGGGKTLEPTEVEFNDGTATIPDRETFEKLSYQGPDVLIDTHLADLEYVKFSVVNAGRENTKIYFINTETHRAHMMFGSAIGLPFGGMNGEGGSMFGVLIYRPRQLSPTGEPGLYTFEFEPNNAFPYDMIRAAYDMLVEYAPILEGNLAYYPLPAARAQTDADAELYEKGELPLHLPENAFAEVGFLPLNKASGYGRLRLMQPGERPSPRDVVLYPTLPNEMPRVAGIITAVRQTPLSHVNLRAIQDRVPNAFIVGADQNESITGLLGKYVSYRVSTDGYELREASAEEVERHFADLRPSETQVPPRDLSKREIVALEDLGFGDSPSIGVKAANIAAMHEFGFAGGLVPGGFAVPFSFYDEFMKHNEFYAAADKMIAKPEFQDTDEREKALKKFRKKVARGEMPEWMTAALGAVQAEFPEGSSIRCRSSTNNEDLAGFSGAGLYDSVTHHPDEGHLAESIKQVFASLWNFRAHEEREFHRIDHMQAAMGVLLHENYDAEQANGVAVTQDIVYETGKDGKLFYVNTQRGEDLVTNPGELSVPEELLLAPRNPKSDRVVRRSNRADDGAALMSEDQRMELRRCLRTIEKEFSRLYQPAEGEPFAMEIEFKITAAGTLAIKQARPWVF